MIDGAKSAGSDEGVDADGGINEQEAERKQKISH